MIEKALAKKFGSYALTEGGIPCFGMLHLCGGQAFRWQKTGRNWTKFMCKGITSQRSDVGLYDEVSSLSQLSGTHLAEICLGEFRSLRGTTHPCQCVHLFTGNLDIAQLDRNDGGCIVLIKPRNPWGQKEWTGDWHDASSKWNLGY